MEDNFDFDFEKFKDIDGSETDSGESSDDLNSIDSDSSVSEESDGFGFDLDEDYTFSTEVNYSSYIGKVLRVFTKGMEQVTKGKMKDFLGDICLVEDYYEDSETLILERLGLKDKYKIEKKYIEKITGARLPDNIKEASKNYHKSTKLKIKNIRKILSLKEREKAYLNEISSILHKIGYMAEETYEPLIDQDDHMSGGMFNTFGNVGSSGSYGSVNSRFGHGGSSFTGNGFSGSSNQGFSSFNNNNMNNNNMNNQGKSGGLFGNLFKKNDSMNSKGSFGNNSYGNNSYGNNSYGNNSYGNNSYGNNSYGNNSYGNNSYGNKRKVDKSTKNVKNGEGMQVFRKDIFGNELAMKERTSSGKKKKKPTVLMKNNKTYYVKLLGGEMMVVYVRIDQLKDYKNRVISEEKYYYSEFGLVESREIVWFREKMDNERGTREIKDGFRRVFSLEKQLNKIYEKMEESDKTVRIEEQRRIQILSYLHVLVIQAVKSGDLYYQSKSKIEFNVGIENNVKVIYVKGIENKVMNHLYSNYSNDLGKVVYKSQYNLLKVPLVRGVRYAELKDIFLKLINIYGNAEKSRVRREMLDILDKILL